VNELHSVVGVYRVYYVLYVSRDTYDEINKIYRTFCKRILVNYINPISYGITFDNSCLSHIISGLPRWQYCLLSSVSNRRRTTEMHE
jgi:hypothetical protein